MIVYTSGAFGHKVLFRLHGSAVLKSCTPAVLSSVIYILLFEFTDIRRLSEEETPLLEHPYPMGALIAAFSFLLIFRANFAYNRYWEAQTAVHAMHSKWLDFATELAAFHMQADCYRPVQPPSFGAHAKALLEQEQEQEQARIEAEEEVQYGEKRLDYQSSLTPLEPRRSASKQNNSSADGGAPASPASSLHSTHPATVAASPAVPPNPQRRQQYAQPTQQELEDRIDAQMEKDIAAAAAVGGGGGGNAGGASGQPLQLSLRTRFQKATGGGKTSDPTNAPPSRFGKWFPSSSSKDNNTNHNKKERRRQGLGRILKRRRRPLTQQQSSVDSSTISKTKIGGKETPDEQALLDQVALANPDEPLLLQRPSSTTDMDDLQTTALDHQPPAPHQQDSDVVPPPLLASLPALIPMTRSSSERALLNHFQTTPELPSIHTTTYLSRHRSTTGGKAVHFASHMVTESNNNGIVSKSINKTKSPLLAKDDSEADPRVYFSSKSKTKHGKQRHASDFFARDGQPYSSFWRQARLRLKEGHIDCPKVVPTPHFLEEAAHLLSLMSAVAFSTLRNDLEEAESPLAEFRPGAPWPHVDPDAYQADIRKGWERSDHKSVTIARYLCGISRTDRARTLYNAGRPFRVIGNVSDAEIDALQTARGPQAKVALVSFWLQEFLSREYLAGSTGAVAPPIISRLYQFASDGMAGYNQARKIAYIPFPFPHAQITTLFVLVIVGFIPVLMLSYLGNEMFGFFLNWITVMCFTGLHEVARELENPFQNVPNDIPLNNFQAQFNEGLMVMFFGFHPDAYWTADVDEHDETATANSISKKEEAAAPSTPTKSSTQTKKATIVDIHVEPTTSVGLHSSRRLEPIPSEDDEHHEWVDDDEVDVGAVVESSSLDKEKQQSEMKSSTSNSVDPAVPLESVDDDESPILASTFSFLGNFTKKQPSETHSLVGGATAHGKQSKEGGGVWKPGHRRAKTLGYSAPTAAARRNKLDRYETPLLAMSSFDETKLVAALFGGDDVDVGVDLTAQPPKENDPRKAHQEVAMTPTDAAATETITDAHGSFLPRTVPREEKGQDILQ